MNICLISREYFPDVTLGGIGTYTRNMSRALCDLGHNVHVITSTKGKDTTYTDNGLTFHLLSQRRVLPKEIWYLRYSHAVKRQFLSIDCRFDIVQASEFAAEALWLSIGHSARLITRLATPLFLVRKLMRKGNVAQRPLVNWMERFQTTHSDAIFSSTHVLADVVCDNWKLDRTNVAVIPNSIDIKRVIRLGDGRSETLPFGINEYLLFFGRLEERKGVHILAQALPAVFKQFPKIKVVFAGEDHGFRGQSMLDYVMQCAVEYQENIIFLGGCPQEKLFPVLKSAKLVVLPSLWEAFGFVSIEAMALGRPVIATSGSGFAEIIENGVSGLLVEPGNQEALSAQIIRCLSGDEDLRKISHNAKIRALEFEVSEIANRLEHYYETVLMQKPE